MCAFIQTGILSNPQCTSDNLDSMAPINPSIEGRPFIDIDPDVVQVKATNTELERRIAAFTSRKRALLDSANCLEFCGTGGAARVAAVLGRSRGSKGHLRKSTADNSCHVLLPTPSKRIKLEPNVALQVPIDQRMSELEERVFFREGQPVPVPVYTRLKQLEDRVLELEGLSPEYCNPLEIVKNRDREQAAVANKEARVNQLTSNLKNINSRIIELKNVLRSKLTDD